MTATGYVLAAYVEDGQHVSRGDVLFDVVPDVLDGMVGGDGHVYMPEDGVLLNVSAVSGEQAAKDAVLATYCPKDAMRLVCSVDEQDLSELAVGDVMQVTLDAYEDKPLSGTIVKIASASGDDGTSTSFDVTDRAGSQRPDAYRHERLGGKVREYREKRGGFKEPLRFFVKKKKIVKKGLLFLRGYAILSNVPSERSE